MAGPITYVKPEWDLERQLLEKQTAQLLREQSPPWESDEYKQAVEEAQELGRKRAQEFHEKHEAAEKRAREEALRRQESYRKNEKLRYNQLLREDRRYRFRQNKWLGFKIWLYGLFGVSAFQVIWHDRH